METEVKFTRGGITYDLVNSPYRRRVVYSPGRGITFAFSSQLYKNKFDRDLEDHRAKINESLSNRFGFEIKSDMLSDIKLYSTIEKRGFYIKGNKKEFTCLDNLVLDGKTLIAKN